MAQVDPSGELFFVLRPLEPPFERQLARVPIGCLLGGGNCNSQIVPGFPWNKDMSLSWSADGRQALIYDDYENELLAYEPENDTWQAIAGGFSVFVEGLLPRSPDGSWIAIVDGGDDPESSQIVLLRPNGSERRLLEANVPTWKVPVGWIDAGTLLVAGQQSKIKGTNLVTEPGLYRVDIQTNRWTILLDTLQLTNSPVLSPDGRTLAFSIPQRGHDEIHVMDLENGEIRSLGHPGRAEIWSPDGQWLAVQYEDSLSIIRLDGSGFRTVFQGTTLAARPIWLPKTPHLVIQTYDETFWPPEKGRERLFLVSIPDGHMREIVIPELSLTHELAWASIRPSVGP
jgi:sugar lactone lactonase YvrE